MRPDLDAHESPRDVKIRMMVLGFSSICARINGAGHSALAWDALALR